MRPPRHPHARPVLLALLLCGTLAAQDAPRQLNTVDAAKLRKSVDRSKADSSEAAARQTEAWRQQQALRQQQAALDDQEAAWEEEPEPVQQPTPGFAEILAHGMGVFQDEMAKKNAEQAAANARLAQIRAQAEVADRERERQRRQQELEARQRQQQIAQQQVAAQARVADTAAQQARERELRENAAAERQRLLTQQQQATAERQARERADAQARQQAEQQRLASEKASAERERKAQAERVQGLRQAEQGLRAGFSGRAATCIGGGKDVLYLQTSRPTKTGCRVSFEARCPGTPSGAGVRFSQANYVGGSCQGLGDNIRIGAMACAAEQVQVTMTQADCGSNG
ncbi:hypothetical protein [Stenotrophomonas panacihumi]|uniref:hypothetical protein n=1 Tax=Stenotrophomonas panacihumi TaxID=676599 RepID=UPI000AB804CE|nr:hypothetical protein [Stenotrophomonas panacihumi]